MAEAGRRLRTNKKLEEQLCGWCGRKLTLGEEAVVCTACEMPHHSTCWDRQAGCARSGCNNEPLPQMAPPMVPSGGMSVPPPPPAPFGQPTPPAQGAVPPVHQKVQCVHCGNLLDPGAPVCVFCNSMQPTVAQPGHLSVAQQTAPGAQAALIWGIVSLFCCGIITGWVAISYANRAHTAIAMDPTLGGKPMATAGKVMGIISIVLGVLGILLQIMVGAASP